MGGALRSAVPNLSGMLQVTPNGPWGKDVHPNMPVTIDELLQDLRECFRAGATGVHLHERDETGAETLDPVVVNQTWTSLDPPPVPAALSLRATVIGPALWLARQQADPSTTVDPFVTARARQVAGSIIGAGETRHG